MEGGELLDRMVKTSSEEEAAVIMAQMCSAVKYLHDRIIAHRDIKPENFLFSSDGQLKLTDFGFAEVVFTRNCLKSFSHTPYYAAPEVLERSEDYFNNSCDIWSLGVILYMLLSGLPPFYSDCSSEMRRRITTGQYHFPDQQGWKDVSQEAKDLIRGCLEIDVRKRYTIWDVINSNLLARNQLNDCYTDKLQ